MSFTRTNTMMCHMSGGMCMFCCAKTWGSELPKA